MTEMADESDLNPLIAKEVGEEADGKPQEEATTEADDMEPLISKEESPPPASQEPDSPQITRVQNSSLSLLAEYDTSSEDSDTSSDSVDSDDSETDFSGIEVPEATSDTDSSDSSSSSSDESITEIRKKIVNLDEEEEDEDVGSSGPAKFKVPGELGIEDLPPIEDLHISVPETECTLIGKTSSIVEQLVLVETFPNTAPVDLDSVLFLDHGKRALGKVFDVMGPVSSPIYCIRFNSKEDIAEKNITVGMEVFCAPACTQFVILPNLMRQKGSDASWRDDIEPPDRYLEFSDDEEERNARRSARIQKLRNTPETSKQQPAPMYGPQYPQQFRPPPRPYARQNPNFRPQTPPHFHPLPRFVPVQGPMYAPYGPAPYGPPGQFFANPFAYPPNMQYPPFAPMFGPMAPPPPPPPQS